MALWTLIQLTWTCWRTGHDWGPWKRKENDEGRYLRWCERCHKPQWVFDDGTRIG